MFRIVTTQIVSRISSAAHSRHLNRTIPPTMTTASISVLNFVREKYVTSGIQGNRNSKTSATIKKRIDSDDDTHLVDDSTRDDFKLHDSDYECIANEAMHVTKNVRSEQNVFIIQPYIKWGPKKSATTPDLKLRESVELISSLDTWRVQESLKVGLESSDKVTLFGRGKLAELTEISRKYNENLDKKISCVFVSKSVLTKVQKESLEKAFLLPVMDRFSVVIQILRMHATSRESKLQVALAEIPYIWRQLGVHDQVTRAKLTDSQKLNLRSREKRIKTELESVRNRRQLIRNRRVQKQFPIIAVVGYTNAGKTSLIKALTNEMTMQPRNQLFATLDITAHGGVLPCNLNVIYMDTIGFMSDIPTELIECFVATLEDAMLADLVIHVQDVSHPNFAEQRKHVESTLQNLLHDPNNDNPKLLHNIINVGNKCDLVSDLAEVKHTYGDLNNDNATGETMHFISSTQMSGLHDLAQAIERNILHVTERKRIIIRVPQGGQELPWLYKNTAVVRTEADPKNCNYIFVHLVITDLVLQQFKSTFLSRK